MPSFELNTAFSIGHPGRHGTGFRAFRCCNTSGELDTTHRTKRKRYSCLQRFADKVTRPAYASHLKPDKWSAYDGLVFDGYKHTRINHSKQYSDRRGGHVNGIENFWSFAKRRLAKFNGVSRETFLLHLKECEFRYNHKGNVLETLLGFVRLSGYTLKMLHNRKGQQ